MWASPYLFHFGKLVLKMDFKCETRNSMWLSGRALGRGIWRSEVVFLVRIRTFFSLSPLWHDGKKHIHFVLCTRTFINVNFQIVIFVFENRVDFLQLTKCACHFWCIIPKLTSQSACPWTTALTNHGKRRITSKLFKRDVKPFSWKIYMFKFVTCICTFDLRAARCATC